MKENRQKSGLAARQGGENSPQSKNTRQAPKARDCKIYERYVLEGETQEAVAADYKISRQRVAQVIAKVEGWIAGHPDHVLARNSRELAQAGIDRVYFVVIGSGFRQDDLENLAGFMAAEPIRSVCFLDVHALMRIVNDSIRERSSFRLASIDRLLFGNKIIESGPPQG